MLKKVPRYEENEEVELQVQAVLTSVLDGSGSAVAQLVETLRYKPAGRGFGSQWCQ
jgi:hypothetical protein